MPRSRPVAFVDESRRGQNYLLACVLVEVHLVDEVRHELRTLVAAPKRRIHFNGEPPARRRALLERFDQLPIDVHVTATTIAHDQREHDARALLLARLVADVQQAGATRLVLESRDAGDRDDRHVINRARRREIPLAYEHERPEYEPILWIADAYAWAVGAGRTWTDLVPRTLHR